MIQGQLLNFGKFFPVNRIIYSSLCALMPPKENCAMYSAWLVYVCACIPLYVCVSHICFNNIAALCLKMAAPPAVALPGAKCGENPKKKKAIAIFQEQRCYSGSRHLPKIAILRPGCAIYRRYLFCFAPSIFDAEYNFVNKVWFQPTNANTERDASNKHLDWTD